MVDESALLEAARRRDPDAMGRIFDEYAPSLFRYALRLCHDPAEADQIVGDVFGQLLEQLTHGKGPRTNLRSYLYQIAYHVIVDHSREESHISSIDEALNLPDGASGVVRVQFTSGPLVMVDPIDLSKDVAVLPTTLDFVTAVPAVPATATSAPTMGR